VSDASEGLPIDGNDAVSPLDTAIPVRQASRDDLVNLQKKKDLKTVNSA
jgi:hypothetical protein